jgi:hypothetical protein
MRRDSGVAAGNAAGRWYNLVPSVTLLVASVSLPGPTAEAAPQYH